MGLYTQTLWFWLPDLSEIFSIRMICHTAHRRLIAISCNQYYGYSVPSGLQSSCIFIHPAQQLHSLWKFDCIAKLSTLPLPSQHLIKDSLIQTPKKATMFPSLLPITYKICLRYPMLSLIDDLQYWQPPRTSSTKLDPSESLAKNTLDSSLLQENVFWITTVVRSFT